MTVDAEAHAGEDHARREQVEKHNQLDTLLYQADKTLTDNRDKLPEAERTCARASAHRPPPTINRAQSGPTNRGCGIAVNGGVARRSADNTGGCVAGGPTQPWQGIVSSSLAAASDVRHLRGRSALADASDAQRPARRACSRPVALSSRSC